MHKDLKEVKGLTKFTNREELGKGLSQKLGLMLEEQPGGWSGWRVDRTWELRPHRMVGAEATEDNARRVSANRIRPCRPQGRFWLLLQVNGEPREDSKLGGHTA